MRHFPLCADELAEIVPRLLLVRHDFFRRVRCAAALRAAGARTDFFAATRLTPVAFAFAVTRLPFAAFVIGPVSSRTYRPGAGSPAGNCGGTTDLPERGCAHATQCSHQLPATFAAPARHASASVPLGTTP